MKSFFIFWIGGCFAITMVFIKQQCNPTITPINHQHPAIKSASDIYQIKMNDSISDVCYDSRSKKVVILDGILITSQCPLDSNRWHFNIKTK